MREGLGSTGFCTNIAVESFQLCALLFSKKLGTVIDRGSQETWLLVANLYLLFAEHHRGACQGDPDILSGYSLANK